MTILWTWNLNVSSVQAFPYKNAKFVVVSREVIQLETVKFAQFVAWLSLYQTCWSGVESKDVIISPKGVLELSRYEMKFEIHWNIRCFRLSSNMCAALGIV